MSEINTPRLMAAAKEFNIGTSTLVDYLISKGFGSDELKPTSKLTESMYRVLQAEFHQDKRSKEKAERVALVKSGSVAKPKKENETSKPATKQEEMKLQVEDPEKYAEAEREQIPPVTKVQAPELESIKLIDKIDLDTIDSSTRPKTVAKKFQTGEEEAKRGKKKESVSEENVHDVPLADPSEEGKSAPPIIEGIQAKKLTGPKIMGKIDLPVDNDTRPKHDADEKHKRKRIPMERGLGSQQGNQRRQDNIKGSENRRPARQELKTEDYLVGNQINVTIAHIIKPALIICELPQGFKGLLFLQDISANFPISQQLFDSYNSGLEISCLISSINDENKVLNLSQRHINTPLSEKISWIRIDRGDEMDGVIIEELNNSFLVKTKNNIYGLIHKSFIIGSNAEIKVKVNSKLDPSDLLSFVPANLETDKEENIDLNPEFSFIEEDLRSFESFNKSLLATNATDDECKLILKGFNADKNIFSNEISTNHILYIQFELSSPIYDGTLKQNAIPYFLENQLYSKENEKKLLELLSQKSYWFRINQRQNDNKIDFSLYNEDLNFYGTVQISRDKKDYRFVINSFSFGHSVSTASEAKKRNSKNGSFLFSNPLKILSPFEAVPFDSSQRLFLDYVTLKTACLETINKLKKKAGELLRQEGKTFKIIDKFLEYQMSLIDVQKENNVFVEKFQNLPGSGNEISLKLPISIGNNMELNEKEEIVVNVRIKQGDDLLHLNDGKLSYFQDGCKLTFNPNKPTRRDVLSNGFYLDKRISKKQFQIQREIIQDFIEKKIKIDHIESLLVKPEKIKSPILKKIGFINPDLVKTEIELPDNNQVKAVKKAVGNQNIFLIQGPPGTGKTTVIAEIIQQLVAKGEKILVSGQNHVAVDNVLEKISKLYDLNLLRVGNPERIDKEFVRYSIDNLIEDFKVDFKLFLDNQLLLSKKYLEMKGNFLSGEEILAKYNELVNDVSFFYGKLREIYKDRHFILRDGLNQLESVEIASAIKSIESWIGNNNNEYEILLKPLIYSSIDVVFATCIGIKSDPIFQGTNFKFDTVIIDEAGKANIAETLVAIELGKRVILVGDQMQLPPYMDSSLIDERDPKSFPNSIYGTDYTQTEIIHALKTSFFEFIINKLEIGQFPKENMEMLNYQHRMHPNIGEFVSDSFYEGTVKMGENTHLNRIELPSPFNKEVIFFDTSNSRDPFEQNDGYSAKNNTEAETISEIILPRLFENNISPGSVAIIAPYKSQVANIQHFILNSSLCTSKNIDISTLDSFQGKEYDIIIFSFTRSSDYHKISLDDGKKKNTKVGFLDDARRLNVAFSRAKKKLILVGNAVTLTDSRSHFDGLFNYTQLFRRLVELSKKEAIGNFVNIADLHDFVTPFETFTKRYKVGDIVVSKVKSIGKKTESIFGLFVIIDKVDCLIPIGLMPMAFKEKLETLLPKTELKVIIYKIEKNNQQVTVKLDVWNSNIGNIMIGKKMNGRVIKKVGYGYFVELDCLIQGLLHNQQILGKKPLQLNQRIEVTVINIDFDKQNLLFQA